MISEYIKPFTKGEKILIIYPNNEVLFAVFKLITRIHGIEKLGWYTFNEISRGRLESVFEMFKEHAPSYPGRIYGSYDEIDSEVVIAFGFHFCIYGGCSDDMLVRLVLRKNTTLYFFLLDGSVDKIKEKSMKDLFDKVIEISEKEYSFEKTFTYKIHEYVYPFREYAGTFRVTSEYELIE